MNSHPVGTNLVRQNNGDATKLRLQALQRRERDRIARPVGRLDEANTPLGHVGFLNGSFARANSCSDLETFAHI